MKILSLSAENIKKLVAVEIVPKGNVIELTGKNGSGKTSVLDCISWAFEGLAKVQDKPIRNGETKAWIKLDLGDYIVERTFKTTDKGDVTSSITVTSKDGSVFKQPQTLLDAVFGQLSFDPLKFSRADKKEQVSLLESLVPGFDFAKSRVEEQLAYDERTAANRNAKNSSLAHMSFVDVPVPEPERVDIAGLTKQMAEASKQNTEREKIIAAREISIRERYAEQARMLELITNCKEALAKNRDEVERMKKEIERLEIRIKQDEVNLHNNGEDLKMAQSLLQMAHDIQVQEPVSVDAIKQSLDAATAKNALHEKWVKKNEAKLAVDQFEKQSAALTETINSIQTARFNAVKNAGLPVQGLGFDVDGVNLNGIPFEQCSSGEQLRVSVALAMLSNPKLKVIRVNDGSLLDDDGLALLAKMADEQDYQVWLEKTSGDKTVGIYLEEGRIKTS
jgi:hypothetical protein